jgi:hypothetical protein
VINSTGVRRSCGNTMTPTARAPSSTSSPRSSAHAVEGSAEHAAPARPAASASPATPLRIRRPTRASLQRAPCPPLVVVHGAVPALRSPCPRHRSAREIHEPGRPCSPRRASSVPSREQQERTPTVLLLDVAVGLTPCGLAVLCLRACGRRGGRVGLGGLPPARVCSVEFFDEGEEVAVLVGGGILGDGPGAPDSGGCLCALGGR